MSGGTIFRFHNGLDTGRIIASRYLLLPTINRMKVHTFESLDPDFPRKVKEGNYVVEEEDFGYGPPREQASNVLRTLGVRAMAAESSARIFYRNSISIGLPVIMCKELPDEIKTGDAMELSLSEGVARINGKGYLYTRLLEYMQDILNQGGLVTSLNKEEA